MSMFNFIFLAILLLVLLPNPFLEKPRSWRGWGGGSWENDPGLGLLLQP